MAESGTEDWGATERLAPADRLDAEALIVDVDGFEGPLDLLLTLSRTQKVDLRKISVLQLAEQYLNFVRQAAALRIELAADYLVMAAWLAFLKSRLLLPPNPARLGLLQKIWRRIWLFSWNACRPCARLRPGLWRAINWGAISSPVVCPRRLFKTAT